MSDQDRQASPEQPQEGKPDASRLGWAGRMSAFFQEARITPLLAGAALALGIMAALITPREEEPQINVTMGTVITRMQGADAPEVESKITEPMERLMSTLQGVDQIVSRSDQETSMVTVVFKVGVPRTEALVRMHDALRSREDLFDPSLGASRPLIRPAGIEDVPIWVAALSADERSKVTPGQLEAIAESVADELKRQPGVKDAQVIGGSGRALKVELDAGKLRAAGVSALEALGALQASQLRMGAGDLRAARVESVMAGDRAEDASAIARVGVGVKGGAPVRLMDVARIHQGERSPERYARQRVKGEDGLWREGAMMAVAVTKEAGANAIEVARGLKARLDRMRAGAIPEGVEVRVARDYGATADEKAKKLISKLVFATLSVVALVAIALGRREALIVGGAVALTLAAALFASWAWGFTLNRVSLFALIFSIGILVDDAIVVVENIHRRQAMEPGKPMRQVIPEAVDEVGGPTWLATLTVIAALLPMAFVSGLMGPYMAPIPINASMGMILSLGIAFAVTPWMALRWMRPHAASGHGESGSGHPEDPSARPSRSRRIFGWLFERLLDEGARGRKARRIAWGGLLGMMMVSMALPILGLVRLKMLPFDNKSEFQAVVDLPLGSSKEATLATLEAMSRELERLPEVIAVQMYAGTASPIDFNGLVRQYQWRQQPNLGQIQVELVDKHHRSKSSHQIAMEARRLLAPIAERAKARLKLVEVPPGPPVASPIVAEVYGPTMEGRQKLAEAIRDELAAGESIVDTDVGTRAEGVVRLAQARPDRAASLGVSQGELARSLGLAVSGERIAEVRSSLGGGEPVEVSLGELAKSDWAEALKTPARSGRGLIALGDAMETKSVDREPARLRKGMAPMQMASADMAGGADSPLYGMFEARGRVQKIPSPDGRPIEEIFKGEPVSAKDRWTIKWDGEWKITYETFRDMGAAYAVGLALIYLLVVAQFGSYLMPLIIMAPIPLTIAGVMPGHALLGAPFTATSMIGMIALAGIIVRNSILMVDFAQSLIQQGVGLSEALTRSAADRAAPIALTGLAAMLGAFFILDDPIFNGLAISLIFGIAVSTALTLVFIPLLYWMSARPRNERSERGSS